MTNNLIYRTAQKDDFHKLALWLVTIGQAPQRQCLHTWSGESADELQDNLLGYFEDGELCYVLATRDDQLVGAMGCEYDEELGRAWLHGPHAIDEDWDVIGRALYPRLQTKLPPVIKQLNAYLNIENKRARQFYIRQGFEEHDSFNYDFWLTLESRVVSGDSDCQMLEKKHEESFKALYASLFPMAYYSGERIINMMGESHQVMVIAEDAEVLGFVIVNTTGYEAPGEIQFLGVREDCRHRKYGRRLLLAGIDWLFDVAKAPRVFLNVGEELVYARALYESVGFSLRYMGVGFRKIVA